MIETSESRNWLRTALVGIIMFAVTAAFFGMIQSFLVTLFLAAVFSAMAQPTYGWFLDKVGGRKAAAAAITLLVLITAVLVPGLLLASLIAGQAGSLATTIGPLATQLVETFNTVSIDLPEWVPFRDELMTLGPQIASRIAGVVGQVGQYLLSLLANATQGTAVFFLQLFVMLYAMFFFLIDGRAIIDRLLRMTTLDMTMQKRIVSQAYIVAKATMKGTLVIGVVQGVLGGIGFWMFGISNSVLWGTVMAIASVIPGIGPTIVWLPAVIYLFVEGSVGPALGLLAWSALLVATVDNVLRPILIGGDTKMPDLVVLISTFGGLASFGAVGLVIGPVLAAVFFTIWDVFAEAQAADNDVDAVSADPPPEAP